MNNILLLIRNALNYFNLTPEIDDFEKIHQSIVKDTAFKGTNLWILVFAIIIASVGLNMNSTAVIIGAMLISPLMGPINGMGYSLATYNFELLRQSAKNFSFAVMAALIASTAYFLISPISTAHSELLARTSPSIYDVLIAMFGGLAGIVAISSKQKGNVIPGVAIATALMPPLCTAGYGLATGQIGYFLGAIFLFTINTVFIALSSVIVSQMLKFPFRNIIDQTEKKKINRMISTVILLVIIPSIYFGYGLVQQERFLDKANRYISNVKTIDGNYLLDHQIDSKARTITLVYGGVNMNEPQKNSIIEKTTDFQLKNVSVVIKQGLSFQQTGDNYLGQIFTLREQINILKSGIGQKKRTIDSLLKRDVIGNSLLQEITPLYPQIVACSFSETMQYNVGIPAEKTSLIVLSTVEKISPADKTRIKAWLEARLNSDQIKLIFDR